MPDFFDLNPSAFVFVPFFFPFVMKVKAARSKDLGFPFLIWRYLLCDSPVEKRRAFFSYLPKKKTSWTFKANKIGM